MAKKPKKKKHGLPNYLEPLPRKKLNRQALKTMNKIYAPAIADINAEESRIQAISEKRRVDNAYYRDWLNNQQGALQANAQAADQQLRTAQQQIHDTNTAAYAAMPGALQQQAAANPGNVSDPSQANAFNVSSEQMRGLESIANERTRTEQMLHSAESTRQTVAASNFAMVAAAEANRVSQLWSDLRDISSGRQKLRLSKAADSAKEVARLLDKEVEKAQIRGELKNQAAQLGLDQASLAETIRHNKATEGLTKRGQNIDAKGDKGGKKGDEVSARQRKQESRKITTNINNGVSFIQNSGSDWNTKSREEWTKLLQKQGLPPLYAQAAIDVAFHGKLSPTTRKSLKSQGYIVPKAWRADAPANEVNARASTSSVRSRSARPKRRARLRKRKKPKRK